MTARDAGAMRAGGVDSTKAVRLGARRLFCCRRARARPSRAAGAPRQRVAATGSRLSRSLRAASGMRGSSHSVSHSTSFAVNT
ncbi:hypothetical protein X946_4888 [Burkholderia sp. ABCPW 111]|nr:hypothetical protein X946_4888 [Burkholderia sp. ABCPW 111]